MSRPDAEDWRKLDALFAELLEVEAADREAWLDSRIDDPETRRELEALLEAAAFTGFMGTQAGEQLSAALSSALDASPGGRSGQALGPYRLGELVGRGGMADVYRADRVDGTFEQTVAVKVQRRGTDTDDVLDRFRAERQILSDLDHPNIARLIDGGATDDGLPYLVMEYVEGVPITDYCERERLPVRRRLELFLEVGRAVQRAHSMLVVHRDIKPNNVLVSDTGEVKLLDFGIAKFLDPSVVRGAPHRTRTGLRPLTPRYASPEQVLGGPITVASDIYQLGLLLYRMLTGGLPFEDRAEGRALEDAITETRPERPSEHVTDGVSRGLDGDVGRWRRALRGDLDTIVLKALRKEPERRYTSAHEMVDDVQRHLEGRPISARMDSRVYLASRFFKRNPWVAPAALTAAGLVALYVGTLIRHGQRLEVERNAARVEARRAEASQEFLVGLFRSADPFAAAPQSNRDIRVSEVMNEGFRRASTELAGEPEVQVSLLSTIGDVFLGLGDAERALEVHDSSVAISRRQFGEDSPEVARALRSRVEAAARDERRNSGNAYAASDAALEALSAVRRALGNEHVEAYRAEVDLSGILSLNGRYASSEILLRHALAGIRGSADAGPEDEIKAVRYLANALNGQMANVDSVELRSYYLELVRLTEDAFGADHVRTAEARLIAASSLGEPAATRQRQLAIPVLLRDLGPEHDQLARAYFVHGLSFMHEEMTDSAVANLHAAADVWLRAGSSVVWPSMALTSAGQGLVIVGRAEEARGEFERALAIVKTDSTTQPRRIAFIERDLAWAEYEAGRAREAVLARIRRFLDVAGDFRRVGMAECVGALALADLGRQAEAQTMGRRGLQLAAENSAPSLELESIQPCAAVVDRGIAFPDSSP